MHRPISGDRIGPSSFPSMGRFGFVSILACSSMDERSSFRIDPLARSLGSRPVALNVRFGVLLERSGCVNDQAKSPFSFRFCVQFTACFSVISPSNLHSPYAVNSGTTRGVAESFVPERFFSSFFGFCVTAWMRCRRQKPLANSSFFTAT